MRGASVLARVEFDDKIRYPRNLSIVYREVNDFQAGSNAPSQPRCDASIPNYIGIFG